MQMKCSFIGGEWAEKTEEEIGQWLACMESRDEANR